MPTPDPAPYGPKPDPAPIRRRKKNNSAWWDASNADPVPRSRTLGPSDAAGKRTTTTKKRRRRPRVDPKLAEAIAAILAAQPPEPLQGPFAEDFSSMDPNLFRQYGPRADQVGAPQGVRRPPFKGLFMP